jgi:putative NADH-flavin reductase
MIHKLAIFGISGRTGRELAKAASLKGWEIRGFARPTSSVDESIVDYEIVRGSFTERKQVVQTIADSEAVCCTIGPGSPYKDVFCSIATAAIIEAMHQTGCRRLVCQTGAMIGPAPNRTRPMEWLARAFASQHPEIARDREEQEQIIRSSNLEWTIVKPPRLSDSPPRNRVKASTILRIGLMSRISLADLVAFILDEVQACRYSRQRVFVKG